MTSRITILQCVYENEYEIQRRSVILGRLIDSFQDQYRMQILCYTNIKGNLWDEPVLATQRCSIQFIRLSKFYVRQRKYELIKTLIDLLCLT